jgi:integrase
VENTASQQIHSHVRNLGPGKGPIKKSDYRRELKSGEDRPEIYTRDELKLLFEAMTPEERVFFELFPNAGLRKQEMMFLEEDDLIVETLAPGLVKRQIRVTSKPRLGFMTKNGRTRFVPIDRDLMNKLLALKATNRPSRLLFGTRTGLPDYHMLDTLRSVSGRAGIEPSHCWLHKFRSTCATNWLRSKRLGGKGYDIGVVRDWLGHDECKSIESYIGIVREEELIEVNEPVKVPENPTAELGIVHTPYVSDATLTRLRYAQGLLMVHVPNTLPERHCRHASLMTQKYSNSGSKT